jgi:phenylpropionate dioxygenase-like ring-hydroxylating dioxygenase large terminal subunit
MFQELPDQWLPVLPSSRLPQGRPEAVTLDGVPLALFRGPGGSIGAVLDRCPHRSVRLSKGSCVNGQLTCPFHGWRFGTDGSCQGVPLQPDANRSLLGVAAAPALERGGLVWVYTRLGEAAPPPLPELPEALEDPQITRRDWMEDWATHWTRAMENMLDIPHLPFVHRRTIGADLARQDLMQQAVEYELEEDELGFRLAWSIGGQRDNGHLRRTRPNGMVLTVVTPVGELRQHVYCVPLEPGRTRMLLVSTSRRPWWARLIPTTIFEGFEDRILLEDQAVVESAPPGSVLEGGQAERSVASDRPTLRFRRYYRSLQRGAGHLAAEAAREPEAAG